MAYTNYYPTSRLFHGSISSIMGTQLDVLLIGGEEDFLRTVWQDLESEVVRLHKMLNRFDENSEVAHVNSEAGYYPVVVSEELWTILQDCRRYYELTKGYFDITLGDFSRMLFDETAKSVYFLSESMHIDLGGMGKGYALKKFHDIFIKNGIKCGLANFGNSSVLAVGSHPCGDYWPIGLNDPYTQQVIKVLKLKDDSLSISGNMPSHPKHIVNPLTGLYVEDHKMVSVVSADPVDAEVLTTTLMLLADEKTEKEICSNFEIREKQTYRL